MTAGPGLSALARYRRACAVVWQMQGHHALWRQSEPTLLAMRRRPKPGGPSRALIDAELRRRDVRTEMFREVEACARATTETLSGVPMSDLPTPAEALALAMAAYRAAVAEVELRAGGPIHARPVFLLDGRTLRATAASDEVAALELRRREARAELHRAAEAAALAPEAPVSVPASRASAPTRAREEASAPPPPTSAGSSEPWHVRVRLWRRSAGLTQAQAAEQFGVPKSTWSTWEQPGAAPPKADTLPRLSALTGIPASVFLESNHG